MRHGVSFEELSADQRELTYHLLRTFLSEPGFALARNIMRLNGYVGELSGWTEEFSEWFYWISIFGTPSLTAPWGWQIDGHHLALNCFVLGNQTVTTPAFLGSEPVVGEG